MFCNSQVCSAEESTCQCRRHRRPGLNLWVGKIPWRRKWQPTPVFLPGKLHGQRLVGYGPWGHKESTPLSFWINVNSSPSRFSSGLVLSLNILFLQGWHSFISLLYTGLRSLLVSRALSSALDLQIITLPPSVAPRNQGGVVLNVLWQLSLKLSPAA